MQRFPLMVFRLGKALEEYGLDFTIVECEAELVNALSDGWHEGLEAHDAAPSHPLDLDGDGEEGGSLPADERGLDDLIAEAAALGVKVDKRWGEKRLLAEIAKAG